LLGTGRSLGARTVLSQSYESALRLISDTPRPAWLWDIARRRIVFANTAGVTFWDAASLEDLIERRFAESAEAGGETVPARLRDGRPGLIVTADAVVDGAGTDLFTTAPAALAAFDAAGRRLAASDEARDLLMPGDLGIVFSSPYLAAEVSAALAADSFVSRTLPVATRFGMRRCRVTGKRIGDGEETRLVFAFDDIEDRLALAIADAPLPVAPVIPAVAQPQEHSAEPVALPAALEDLVAALPDATLAADAAGRVVAINVKASQLLG